MTSRAMSNAFVTLTKRSVGLGNDQRLALSDFNQNYIEAIFRLEIIVYLKNK
jgi:hypothetical protein